MEKRKTPFPKEELELALKKGAVHDTSLDPDHITTVAKSIFHENNLVKQGQYLELVKGNYEGLDLIKHGFHHFIADLKLLTEFFSEAIKTVRTTTTRKNRTNKVLMMGCGSGRLSIAAIELAKKLNLEEIVFNDLIPEHIEQTRERIASAYGTREENIDGINLYFKGGDFLEVSQNIRKNFDAVFSMWFVTSEIADFTSVKALKRKREALYSP